MRKKQVLLIVAAAALVAVLVGGVVLYSLLTSPQYALKKMVDDVQANGVQAIEPHLTGSAEKMYSAVYDFTQNSLVQLVSRVTDAQKILGILNGESGSWEYTLDNVKTTGSNSSVTLHIQGGSFSGNLNIEMQKIKGSWKISDVSVPIGSWIFP